MFRAFVEATGYATTAEREGYGHPYKAGPKEQERPQVPGADWQHPRGPGSEAQDDHSVVQVSWDDAAACCARVGGTLPAEAQWEKACRGTDARMYPWGDQFDERRMNYCDAQCRVERWGDPNYDDGYAYTSPVGSYLEGASPYGVLDMAGNMWEWTADRYDAQYYASSPHENPQGPETGDERVQHGRAWYDGGPAGWLTCTIHPVVLPYVVLIVGRIATFHLQPGKQCQAATPCAAHLLGDREQSALGARHHLPRRRLPRAKRKWSTELRYPTAHRFEPAATTKHGQMQYQGQTLEGWMGPRLLAQGPNYPNALALTPPVNECVKLTSVSICAIIVSEIGLAVSPPAILYYVGGGDVYRW